MPGLDGCSQLAGCENAHLGVGHRLPVGGGELRCHLVGGEKIEGIAPAIPTDKRKAKRMSSSEAHGGPRASSDMSGEKRTIPST